MSYLLGIFICIIIIIIIIVIIIIILTLSEVHAFFIRTSSLWVEAKCFKNFKDFSQKKAIT